MRRPFTITQKITSRESDSFKQYLKEISDIPMFTTDEELECAKKAYNGDIEARNELVRRNLRFVISVAKTFVLKDIELADLVNEGNIGLTLAANKFNPDKGFKFISYAIWWIRKVIIEHLNNNGKLVRFPSNKINFINSLEGKITDLEQTLCRTPDIYEVLDLYGDDMSFDEQRLMHGIKSFQVESFDKETSFSDGSSFTLYETIPDTTFGEVDSELNKTDLARELNRVISRLKPKNQVVMNMLYGLEGKSPMTLKEVGETLGITRETARQIKEKSLRKLKNELKNSLLVS